MARGPGHRRPPDRRPLPGNRTTAAAAPAGPRARPSAATPGTGECRCRAWRQSSDSRVPLNPVQRLQRLAVTAATKVTQLSDVKRFLTLSTPAVDKPVHGPAPVLRK